MKVDLTHYDHRSNGVSLFLIPETPIERKLLEALFKHGRLMTCNGIMDNSTCGFAIQWNRDAEQPK